MQRLQHVAVSAYTRWAHWASASLVTELQTALTADDMLRSSTTPLSWSEVVLSGDGGGGSEGRLEDLDAGDMRFSLPSCPSGATLTLLMSACWVSVRGSENRSAVLGGQQQHSSVGCQMLDQLVSMAKLCWFVQGLALHLL